jgi:hypothetical protein
MQVCTHRPRRLLLFPAIIRLDVAAAVARKMPRQQAQQQLLNMLRTQDGSTSQHVDKICSRSKHKSSSLLLAHELADVHHGVTRAAAAAAALIDVLEQGPVHHPGIREPAIATSPACRAVRRQHGHRGHPAAPEKLETGVMCRARRLLACVVGCSGVLRKKQVSI